MVIKKCQLFALLALVGLNGSIAFRAKRANTAEGFVPPPSAASTAYSGAESKVRPFANPLTASAEVYPPKEPMGIEAADSDFAEPESPLASGSSPQGVMESDTTEPEEVIEPAMTSTDAMDAEWELQERVPKKRAETTKEYRVPVQPAVFLMGGLLLLGAASFRRKGTQMHAADGVGDVEPSKPIVAVGDKIPNISLDKGFPPIKVAPLFDYCQGKKIVLVGLPGAFTPT
jgi:hypothetical protein